jgi:transcriptional regulator with XRE-family HTH domain
MLAVPHRPEPDAADQTDRQLGALVRARRIERGLSQTSLARAVGVSQAAISGVESGRHGHSSDTIRAICRFLDLPPPLVGQPAELRRWFEAGRVLLNNNAQLFGVHLAMIEHLIAALPPGRSDVHEAE